MDLLYQDDEGPDLTETVMSVLISHLGAVILWNARTGNRQDNHASLQLALLRRDH